MQHRRKIEAKRRLRLLTVVAVALLSLNATPSMAQNFAPAEYRYAVAGNKFDEVEQFALAFAVQSPDFLRADRLEFAVGAISDQNSDRLFLSLGPVWRLPISDGPAFVEFGISPTWIDGSILDGRDLGGNVHFTSAVAIGAAFGRHRNVSVSLRAQHTSNGGLSNTNPGLDMIGLNVAFDFAGQ
ncbi:MAG: acyloxyacyl hydrolase [Woeseiaceae bacterium]|nr:acyloxyacyl hydrolase [Woeseiaceae bacterium]